MSTVHSSPASSLGGSSGKGCLYCALCSGIFFFCVGSGSHDYDGC